MVTLDRSGRTKEGLFLIFLMKEKMSETGNDTPWYQSETLSFRVEVSWEKLTIPSTTVQSRGVFPEFEDDLVHHECGGDGFDEDGSSDGSTGESDVVLLKSGKSSQSGSHALATQKKRRATDLGEVEDVVPQPGLKVVFHLGQVEVRTISTLDQLLRAVARAEEERRPVRMRNGCRASHETGAGSAEKLTCGRSRDRNRRLIPR